MLVPISPSPFILVSVSLNSTLSKYVDFLPAVYGSVAMFARELVEISGADFDIDKVYSQIKEWYVKDGVFIEYGKATTEQGQYNDYIEYVKNKVTKKGSVSVSYTHLTLPTKRIV